MISVELDWTSATTISPTTFDGLDDISLHQLQAELAAVDASVTGLWLMGETLHVVIDSDDVAGKQADINAVIAAHVPQPEVPEDSPHTHMIVNGVTNGSGIFTHTYPEPLPHVPHLDPTLGASFELATARVTSNTVNGFAISVQRPVISALVVVSAPCAACPMSVNVTYVPEG